MTSPIVYFDIAGPEPEKLLSFYSSVFGWSIDANGAITGAGAINGTLRQDPAEKILYIQVPSIDAALEQIIASGGAMNVPRTVIPGVVTFALFTDPAGNRMGLVEPPEASDG
jgi:predicted enzyme related to lactoylglutathione lyase